MSSDEESICVHATEAMGDQEEEGCQSDGDESFEDAPGCLDEWVVWELEAGAVVVGEFVRGEKELACDDEQDGT